MSHMGQPFKAKTNSQWTVENLIITRRTIKRVLAASGRVSIPGLYASVRNLYQCKMKIDIDNRQSAVALRQLIAEGDVVLDDGRVYLAPFERA